MLRVSDTPRGDIDGDGIDDLILPAYYETWDGVVEAGTVRIFRGRTDWPAEVDRNDYDLLLAGSRAKTRISEPTGGSSWPT